MKTTLDNGWWEVQEGDGPGVAVALHSGHAVWAEMEPLLALSPPERLREEDPFTDAWTTIVPTRIVACHSRFGLDLNRPREKAVYLLPEDAWGLRVWNDFPDENVIAASLHRYDEFYRQVREILARKIEQYGRFLLFDIHSYNHRRDGQEAPPAPQAFNPDINVGTGTLDRARWGAVVERFMADTAARPVGGRAPDVRENIRFRGGEFPRWVNTTFPGSGCALAIEVKKTFMNEWTGEPNLEIIEELRRALETGAAGAMDEQKKAHR